MLPKIDLFNQEYYRCEYGFVAIISYETIIPNIDVYTPQGEWCGCTNASNDLTRLAAVKGIIKNRIEWESQHYNSLRQEL